LWEVLKNNVTSVKIAVTTLIPFISELKARNETLFYYGVVCLVLALYKQFLLFLNIAEPK
jgi:hypothetical protein